MSEAQFSHALSLGGTKHAEPWIYHFMLGKIGRKLGKPVHQVLDHFLQVSGHIMLNCSIANGNQTLHKWLVLCRKKVQS